MFPRFSRFFPTKCCSDWSYCSRGTVCYAARRPAKEVVDAGHPAPLTEGDFKWPDEALETEAKKALTFLIGIFILILTISVTIHRLGQK